MRFLVDMPLPPALATWLAEQGHDAVHASLVGLAQAPDTQILERARHEQRVVITADLDFPRLLALTHASGPGLILIRGGNYSEHESQARLLRVLTVIPNEELPQSLVIIERRRIRRRRLPVIGRT